MTDPGTFVVTMLTEYQDETGGPIIYLARFATDPQARPGYGRDEADAIVDLLRANRPDAR